MASERACGEAERGELRRRNGSEEGGRCLFLPSYLYLPKETLTEDSIPSSLNGVSLFAWKSALVLAGS